MRDGIEHKLGVGDLVTSGTRAIFRIADIHPDGKLARLEFTTGHQAGLASVNGLRLATVQQVQDDRVSAHSSREAAELRYDGPMPASVRASLRGRA